MSKTTLLHFKSLRFIYFCSLTAFLFLIQAQKVAAQTDPNTADVEDRIQKVENNLMGWVQTQDTLRWTLDQRMASYNIQGLSIAVISNYKIDWAKGYGWADKSNGQPVTRETLFQAASISKSLNGVGVLKLVQDKRLDLNADINQYLTSWKFPYDSMTNNKKITIDNLLSHTAGLTVHGFPGYTKADDLPLVTDILDGKKPSNTAMVRSQFEPGLKYQYSGGGIMISQLIVMDVTSQSYDQYMRQNVLQPMGMTSSFYTQPPPTNKENILATAYRSDGEEVEGKYHIYPEQAAAGLWTNPVDLCKYVIETQLSYQGKSNKVLSPEMTKLRLTPYIDASAALGVFIETRGTGTYFQHSGSNAGFRCIYYGSFEDGYGIAVMVNSDNGGILEEIVNSVASVYGWEDFYNPVLKKVVAVPDSILSSYVGDYRLSGEPVRVTMQENGLLLHYNNMSCNMLFTSDIDFFVRELRGENKFIMDAQGKIVGFSIDDAAIVRKLE